MRPLLDQTPASLTKILEGPGRARQVFRCLAKGQNPFISSDLGQSLKNRLANHTHPPQTDIIAQHQATDRTLKLGLKLSDNRLIETVLIPESSRTTQCVSSQVGCARGCIFCRTGMMGLTRNLSTEEIITQVYLGLSIISDYSFSELRNIVFMGMGEPLDNWTSVSKAIDILTDHQAFGFGARHITLSTVGPSPEKIQLLSSNPSRIAWSLHAAKNDTRRHLVATQKHHIDELMNSWRQLFEARKDPLFVEITLVDGINDQEQDIEAIGQLFKNFPSEVRFNLLPMNDSGTALKPSPQDRVTYFSEVLQSFGYFTSVRKARGPDAVAACGQLANIGTMGA